MDINSLQTCTKSTVGASPVHLLVYFRAVKHVIRYIGPFDELTKLTGRGNTRMFSKRSAKIHKGLYCAESSVVIIRTTIRGGAVISRNGH